jgi:hypothetical protein
LGGLTPKFLGIQGSGVDSPIFGSPSTKPHYLFLWYLCEILLILCLQGSRGISLLIIECMYIKFVRCPLLTQLSQRDFSQIVFQPYQSKVNIQISMSN